MLTRPKEGDICQYISGYVSRTYIVTNIRESKYGEEICCITSTQDKAVKNENYQMAMFGNHGWTLVTTEEVEQETNRETIEI